jgi:hypothetical protein
LGGRSGQGNYNKQTVSSCKKYPNFTLTMKDLLLLLCQYPCDKSNRDVLSGLIKDVVDWHKAVELINAHGIIALAAYNIKESGLEKEIPEDSWAMIENGYRQSIVRNTWLTERWKEVNTILNNAGIKHVLLKGMALEHTLYGSRGLRQMNDTDILVKRDDALKAWYLLQKEGFTHELLKSKLYLKILCDKGKHLPTLYKNGFAVEIHHKLFDNKRYISDNKDPVDSAVEVHVVGTKAWILSNEFQQMHLVDHFERHALEGSVQIRQYADILLHDRTSTVVMPDRYILNPDQVNDIRYRKAAYKINFRSIDPKFRIRYIVGDIFPSVEWMKERYKCTGLKIFLYYPVRIGKLLWLI